MLKINRFINRRVRFVYIMAVTGWPYFFLYLFRAKIGISQHPKQRAKQIEESIYQETGRRVVIAHICIPFLMWGKMEGWLLRLTAWLYAPAVMPGNGRTEWRWYLNLISALLTLLWTLPGKWDTIMFAGFLLFPLPFDFILLVIVGFLLELLVVLAAVWLGWFLYSHLTF